jgi:hypothetical protein
MLYGFCFFSTPGTLSDLLEARAGTPQPRTDPTHLPRDAQQRPQHPYSTGDSNMLDNVNINVNINVNAPDGAGLSPEQPAKHSLTHVPPRPGMPARCRRRLTHRGARREPARCVQLCSRRLPLVCAIAGSTQATGQDGQARADGALAGQAVGADGALPLRLDRHMHRPTLSPGSFAARRRCTTQQPAAAPSGEGCPASPTRPRGRRSSRARRPCPPRCCRSFAAPSPPSPPPPPPPPPLQPPQPPPRDGAAAARCGLLTQAAGGGRRSSEADGG